MGYRKKIGNIIMVFGVVLLGVTAIYSYLFMKSNFRCIPLFVCCLLVLLIGAKIHGDEVKEEREQEEDEDEV